MSSEKAQGSSSEQGRKFELLANSFLKDAGFSLSGNYRSEYLGIEFDQKAWWQEIKKKNQVLIEHTGSFQGDRPGLMRTDSIKKALLSGFLNQTYDNPDRYFIITSPVQTLSYIIRQLTQMMGLKNSAP